MQQITADLNKACATIAANGILIPFPPNEQFNIQIYNQNKSHVCRHFENNSYGISKEISKLVGRRLWDDRTNLGLAEFLPNSFISGTDIFATRVVNELTQGALYGKIQEIEGWFSNPDNHPRNLD